MIDRANLDGDEGPGLKTFCSVIYYYFVYKFSIFSVERLTVTLPKQAITSSSLHRKHSKFSISIALATLMKETEMISFSSWNQEQKHCKLFCRFFDDDTHKVSQPPSRPIEQLSQSWNKSYFIYIIYFAQSRNRHSVELQPTHLHTNEFFLRASNWSFCRHIFFYETCRWITQNLYCFMFQLLNEIW